MPSNIYGDNPVKRSPGTTDPDSRVGLKPHRDLSTDANGKPAYPGAMVERRNAANRAGAERAKGKILDRAMSAAGSALFDDGAEASTNNGSVAHGPIGAHWTFDNGIK